LAPKQKRSGANKARHKGKGSNFREDCSKKKSEDQKHLHKAFGSKTKMARHKQQTHKESSDSDRHALVEHLTK